MFKAQQVGTTLLYGYNLKFESAKKEELSLHVSKTAAYSEVNDPDNDAHPKILRTGRPLELNISTRPTNFSIHGYTQARSHIVRSSRVARTRTHALARARAHTHTPTTHVRYAREYDKSLMLTGTQFRLYHSQAESFLQASCGPDKNTANGEGSIRERPSMTSLSGHIPYLKRLVSDGQPDPANPKNQSAKGVWVFETKERSKGDYIWWSSPVRIRHYASGKYLAVKHDSEDGSNFDCYLVDDSMRDLEERDQSKWDLAPMAEMLFYVAPSDNVDSNALPNTTWSLKVEHRFTSDFGDEVVLYITNTELKKPQQRVKTPFQKGSAVNSKVKDRSGKVVKVHTDETGRPTGTCGIHWEDDTRSDVSAESLKPADTENALSIKSTGLMFSKTWSDKNILKIMPTPANEVVKISQTKDFRTACQTYSAMVSDPTIPLDDTSGDPPQVQLLLSIIDYLNVDSSPPFDKNIQWVATSNSMLPKDFNAIFNTGEVDDQTQRAAKDMDLLAAMFEMGMAAYRRTAPTDPYAGDVDEDMRNTRGLAKFIHIAMQRVYKACYKVQLYFAEEPTHMPEGDISNWLDALITQVAAPVGATVTLSNLLTDNKELQSEFVTQELLENFYKMVETIGPKDRLVNFFEAVCAVGDEPQKANQERVLRLLWHDETNRESSMISLVERKGGELRSFEKKELPDLPSGAEDFPEDYKKTWSRNEADVKSFLGRQSGLESTTKLYVEWSCGIDDWDNNRAAALFYKPHQLGLPDEVRIEELCWVLDKKRLCEHFTGSDFDIYSAKVLSNPKTKKKFERHEQLANYLVAELRMLATMAKGRSFNCVEHLKKKFSYSMLVSMASNRYLPYAR